MGFFDALADAAVTPQAVGGRIGAFFAEQGMTVSDLRFAIAARRSIVSEVASRLPLASLPASTRLRVMGWGETECVQILQALEATHPEHARLLYQPEVFWGYLMPEVDAAKAMLQRAAAATG